MPVSSKSSVSCIQRFLFLLALDLLSLTLEKRLGQSLIIDNMRAKFDQNTVTVFTTSFQVGSVPTWLCQPIRWTGVMVPPVSMVTLTKCCTFLYFK